MVVPVRARERLIGAMLFAKNTHPYEHDDLRFAELYAERIGLVLENIQLYQQAQAAIRARDEFLSLASHELRTPLTALRLSAHVLAHATGRSPSETAGLSQRILRQTARLDRLATRLLDSYEIGNGGLSIDLSLIDIAELVRDVAASFAEMARRAGGEIRVQCDQPILGYFDPVRIEQMVGNLIDNAVKFGGGRPVEVVARTEGANAVIVIHDMGPGISTGEQAQAFDRYNRGAAAIGVGGLGLGLQVVREVAGAHGGTVQIQSQVGVGTTVTVELPLTPRDGVAAARRENLAPRQTGDGSATT
jgi:signal transduction histidine kinase